MTTPQEPKPTRDLDQEPIDRRFTGSRLWSDLSGAEQDEYLLGCFMGEAHRAALEKRMDVFDRTASSIAEGLLGPFFQRDIETGEFNYRPESPERAMRVMNLRSTALRGTRLGRRLENARERQRLGAAGPRFEDDPRLRFENVGPTVRPLPGLTCLSDEDHGGLPLANQYEGDWNDWRALELHQARELRTMRDADPFPGEADLNTHDEDDAPQIGAPPSIPESNVVNPFSTSVSDTAPQRAPARTPFRSSWMQKLIWRFWPPEECRRALAVALTSLEGLDDLGIPIRRQVRDALSRASLVLERVRTQGDAPEMIGLVVTQNVLARHIRSGQYHTYQGMLSTSGNYLLRTFRAVTTQLAERGYITPEEARAATRQIRQVIRDVS